MLLKVDSSDLLRALSTASSPTVACATLPAGYSFYRAAISSSAISSDSARGTLVNLQRSQIPHPASPHFSHLWQHRTNYHYFRGSGYPRGAASYPVAHVIADLVRVLLLLVIQNLEFGELLKDWIDDWSVDENSNRGDCSENRNKGKDVNMDMDDDSDKNNSEVCNEDYISELLSGSHNAYDYYGESDAETGVRDESVDTPDSGKSHSLVNMSEVCD
ncbi:hypothetical protein ZWY2020_029502 [Hordeum vulgare]|nr:hypothetical protein ZWY2020_029502 [Hordeum vulgare]